MKLPTSNSYDTIIIGAGLSGLMIGYTLVREGQKVCIVEKNPVPGGLIQNFKFKGKTFDAGAHYFGGIKPNESLYCYFKYFKLFDKLKFKQLNINAFDKIFFKDKNFSCPQGHDNYIEALGNLFHKEKQGIKMLVDLMNETVHSFPGYNLSHYNKLPLQNILSKNTFDEFSKFIKNKELKNLLFGNSLAYDGNPKTTPFYIYSLLNYSYLESAWRVVGGSGLIAEELAENFKELGGTIHYNYQAEKILLNSKSRPQGVENKQKEVLHSNLIISTIHPSLLPTMLPEKTFRKTYTNRLINLKNTTGMFSIYAILKPRTPFVNSINYCYNCNLKDAEKIYSRNVFAEKIVFITQPEFQEQQYAEAIQILSLMPYAEIAKYADTTIRKRGREYVDFKKKMADKLIKRLGEFHPDLADAITHINTATPLTYRDYTGSKQGSAYGILHDSNNPILSSISHRTKVPGLYIGGQSANIHGLHGVAAGAFTLCSEILGEDYLRKKMTEEV